MTTPEPSATAARELARDLLEREAADTTDLAGHAAAMQQAWARAADVLRRSVGDDGFNALLVRALLSAETQYPLLKSIRRSDASGIHLDIVAAVEGRGLVGTRAAVESLLAAVVEILSDLIGADMVRNLLNQDDHPQAGGRRTQ